MRILGIDPGFGRTGYGIIDVLGHSYRMVDAGCIETSPKTPIGERLVAIYDAITTLIHQHAPDEFAVEQLFFARNVTTALTAAEARGVVLLAAQKAGLPVGEYTPLQVKQAVSGYGRADKKQVQEMVKILLSLREVVKPDDAADALAVAITHAHFAVYNENMARVQASALQSSALLKQAPATRRKPT
ncbi:crossover junction endodeoxyribonuclease RuvC [Ferroacidibacillus organovorans]|uniref:Crossover junction endodeoxyribonuclease RuvC n=1 Tax=Ferroacidibacillus organovorans TaxID=1765683 RepID=A0A1V4ET61_9BACL|nr:crossover junction endodeoxyribonuclease RuvC [Ferroacidibacillus organovorans]OPG15944.1 crossover junction endodeoxyribonuclease RuvC [Ferroacidibacillus organovorans]